VKHPAPVVMRFANARFQGKGGTRLPLPFWEKMRSGSFAEPLAGLRTSHKAQKLESTQRYCHEALPGQRLSISFFCPSYGIRYSDHHAERRVIHDALVSLQLLKRFLQSDEPDITQ
jgi:hypothetical protein